MIVITKLISLNPAEIQLTYVASPGPGGQNVNKVATSAQLRFDVLHSPSLPEDVRTRLLSLLGKSRITVHGELIIKASRFRSRDRNKQDAIARLCQLIKRAAVVPKKRKKTKPSFASKQRRLETKKIHAMKKSLRRNQQTI